MSNDPTLWDHITEEKPSVFEVVKLHLTLFLAGCLTRVRRLWAWARRKPEFAAPIAFILVTLPIFTWTFFEVERKEAKEKAALEEKRKKEKAALEEKRKDALVANATLASKNWAVWQRTFLTEDAKIVCYHGDEHLTWNGEGRMEYRITCNIVEGPKEFSVTCDERHCYKGTPLTKDEQKAAEELSQLRKEYAGKATSHWSEWEKKFVGDAPTTCYHGDNIANYKQDKVDPFYKITCHVGPEKVIVCDQNRCAKGKVEPIKVEGKK